VSHRPRTRQGPAPHAGTAQQREQKLSKRTAQDRARRVARATEDREARLEVRTAVTRTCPSHLP